MDRSDVWRVAQGLVVVGALSAGIGLGLSTGSAASEQRFVFVGDTPYSEAERVLLTGEIAEAIRGGGFPFLVHYGDLKGGGVPCGGEPQVRAAYEEVTGLTTEPLFYTPGDNEWTDCDRDFRTGAPMSELEHLDLIRQVFYYENRLELDSDWRFGRQAQFPENAVWRFGGLQFGTVHLVGTNNGRIEIRMDDVALALALVEARDQANRAWLNRIFGEASDFRSPAAAVVIATQADVTNPSEHAPCTAANPMYCDAFADFREQLRKHAQGFGKPVLLVHGDTGPYCWDREFGGAAAPNLWRLNAAGDFLKPLDATVVTFAPGDGEDPFSAAGLVHEKVPADQC